MLAQAAHRTPPESFALCESEAAAIVLSVRKRSDSNNKAPSRNGNQRHVMVMSLYIRERKFSKKISCMLK
ncbi:hypothetical protein [Lysinibacillus sp. NPDC056232]|uniref:hypothetical protein n=1 Tax=Lysinibacillus sp. NPDC056232 TaxID=3345756 RepID=UPI0035DAA989